MGPVSHILDHFPLCGTFLELLNPKIYRAFSQLIGHTVASMFSSRSHSMSGQSLVQMIISIGVLGIAVLSFATLMTQVTASQALIQARQDQFTVSNEVLTLLYDQNACSMALTPNIQFDPAVAGNDFPNGQNIQIRLTADDVVKTNGTLTNYGIVVNRFQIERASFVATDPSGRNIYLGRLAYQASPKSPTSGLKDFKVQRIGSAYFTVDGTTLVGCSSDPPATTAQVVKNCEDLGGVYNTGTKSCQLKPTQSTCPSGQAATGFDANGTIKCTAVDTTTSDTTVVAANCPTGQFASGMTAQGKLICKAATAPEVEISSVCSALGGKFSASTEKCTLPNTGGGCDTPAPRCGAGCQSGMGMAGQRTPICSNGKWICICTS